MTIYIFCNFAILFINFNADASSKVVCDLKNQKKYLSVLFPMLIANVKKTKNHLTTIYKFVIRHNGLMAGFRLYV